MKKMNLLWLPVFACLLAATSCKKSPSVPADDSEQLKKDILADVSSKVCMDSYNDMYAKSVELKNAIQALVTTTNDANLNSCRTLWKSVRTTWEQTESWLFGPIAANNIDPRIDTWPVDFNSLDSILATSNVLDESYVDNLDDALKGFHPIEYLIWGQAGNKSAASFTAREKEYLTGLAANLEKLCKEVKDSWANGYATQLATAGSGSTAYTTKKAAFTELVDAMAGICDEVANGKMKDPFDQQDPLLEESPFAKNSLTDFANNVRGVMVMYQGHFTADGKGIEDLVRNYNLSLDGKVKTAHTAALASLEAITVPFGEAIISQPTQVQNAMNKINELAAVLESDLKPFLLQYGQ